MAEGSIPPEERARVEGLWAGRAILWVMAGGMVWICLFVAGFLGALPGTVHENLIGCGGHNPDFFGLWFIPAGAVSFGLAGWSGRAPLLGAPLSRLRHVGLAFLGLAVGMVAGWSSGETWYATIGDRPEGIVLIGFTLGGLAGPALAVACARWFRKGRETGVETEA